MTGRTRVEWPGVQVTLKKTVRDQSGKSSRYSGAGRVFDLKPFLSEESSVTVSRQINAPAGGFQMTLADRAVMHGDSVDSLFGIAEPMDVIEIRMAQRPHEYAGQLPMVFRGVITDVRRDEVMGHDGKPSRTVTLCGQDWGKWLQVIQIKYIRGNPLSEDWLSGLIMQSHYGINYMVLPAGEVIQQLTERVANRWLKDFGSADAITPFLVDTSGADPADKVMPQGFNAFPNGTLWDYFHTFGDLGPFYELFIDDTEAGPKLVYRKPPFVTADGEPVYGAIPDMINVDARQVQRLSVCRTDADVANWYWIDHKRLSMIPARDEILMNTAESRNRMFLDHPNTRRELYGIRMMEVASHHGYLFQGAPKEQTERDAQNFLTYNQEKLRRLKLANQDNVVFETGSMTIQGNERVKVGMHVRVKRGKNINLYYAQRVTHSFAPFRSFTTTVNFIRGTGFINRSSNDQLGIKAPYLQEIGRGPYEG